MAKDSDKKLLQWLDTGQYEDELGNDFSKEELAAFRQILHEVDRWVPDNDPHTFKLSAVTSRRKEAKTRTLNNWIPWSVAASLFIASIVGWFFLISSKTTYYTKSGEIRTINLPDGTSEITLASLSKASWDESDWTSKRRIIHLEGKAFLKVGAGSPLSVITDNGTVEVLGTEFEVEEFAQSLFVACYEGKVKAISTSDQSLIIEGGEKSMFDQGNWEEKTSIEGASPAWVTQNISKFENAPLVRVINTLEKVFAVEVDGSRINLKRRFTGSFPNDDLDVALQVITSPLNLTYEVQGDLIILREP